LAACQRKRLRLDAMDGNWASNIVSTTPVLWLSSQPKSITAGWQVPQYIIWYRTIGVTLGGWEGRPNLLVWCRVAVDIYADILSVLKTGG